MAVKNKRKSTDIDDTTPAVNSNKKVKKEKQEERKPDVAVIIPPKEKKQKKKKSKGHKSVVTPVVEGEKEITAAEVPEPVPTKIRKPRTMKVEGEKKSVNSAVGSDEVSKKKKAKKSKKSKMNMEIKPKDVEELKAKGIEYLKLYKHDRPNWKFQTLRQKWLTNNILDATQLTDGLFSVAIEYFSGAKANATSVIVEKAAAIIKTVEESKKADLEDVKYKRSRIIMQTLGGVKE